MKIAEGRSIENEIRAVGWIRDLARPYLKGFEPALEASGPLRGYRFFRALGRGKKARAGFFAGCLLAAQAGRVCRTSRRFDEAENRLHTSKALLCFLTMPGGELSSLSGSR